jgi:D-alanine-D-alanine ligase
MLSPIAIVSGNHDLAEELCIAFRTPEEYIPILESPEHTPNDFGWYESARVNTTNCLKECKPKIVIFAQCTETTQEHIRQAYRGPRYVSVADFDQRVLEKLPRFREGWRRWFPETADRQTVASEKHLIVVEEGWPLQLTMAKNLAMLARGTVVTIPEVRDQERQKMKELLRTFGSTQNDRLQREDAKAEIFSYFDQQLGKVSRSKQKSITFLTHGTPYGLWPYECPVSHILILPNQTGRLILNGITKSIEKWIRVPIALLIDPNNTGGSETSELIGHLTDTSGYLVRVCTGENANTNEISLLATHLPCDLISFTTHAGEVTGYRVTEAFEMIDGKQHTIVYDETLSTGAIMEWPVLYNLFNGFNEDIQSSINWSWLTHFRKFVPGLPAEVYQPELYDRVHLAWALWLGVIVGAPCVFYKIAQAEDRTEIAKLKKDYQDKRKSLEEELLEARRDYRRESSIRAEEKEEKDSAIDKTRYEVILIGIDKAGKWHLSDSSTFLLNANNPKLIKLNQSGDHLAVVPGTGSGGPLVSLSPGSTNKGVDVIFPVLHGPFGEDGTVQGMLKLAGIPFVGASVLGSAVGMDKDVMKRLLRDSGVPVAKFITVRRSTMKEFPYEKVREELGLPFFVKPANLGSSVGVARITSESDFEKARDNAFLFDNKILFEEGIVGREIEISVLGNDNPIVSVPGEIIPKQEFYSYESKYIDEGGATLEVPAKVTDSEIKILQQLALQTFKVLECEGMARVDFFLTKQGKILVNEINTIPGFTKISMYPRLWEASGISYSSRLARRSRLGGSIRVQIEFEAFVV